MEFSPLCVISCHTLTSHQRSWWKTYIFFHISFCFVHLKNFPIQLLYKVMLVSSIKQSDSLHVHTFPFPLGPPSHPSFHPIHLGHPESIELSNFAIQQDPTSQLFYACQCTQISTSQFIPSLLLVHISVFYIHIYFCLANRFICTFFLDSPYKRSCTIIHFLFKISNMGFLSPLVLKYLSVFLITLAFLI